MEIYEMTKNYDLLKFSELEKYTARKLNEI